MTRSPHPDATDSPLRAAAAAVTLSSPARVRVREQRPERITAEHARGLAFIELLEHLPTDHLHTATAATVVVNIDHKHSSTN
ncbi:MAG: hypothetical protein V9E81_02325 [Marmoricola sp.]